MLLAVAVGSGHDALRLNFSPRRSSTANNCRTRRKWGSVVPFIYSHGSLVSPRKHGSFNQISLIPATFSGVYRHKAFAVNSATLMRVAALREIEGDTATISGWDLSDVYVFQAMYRRGRHSLYRGRPN